MITFVCISDTHGMHRQLWVPSGDVVLFAGDLTNNGVADGDIIRDFDDWGRTLPHKHKIAIFGNHEIGFERDIELIRKKLKHWTILDQQTVIIDGIKIYGEPRSLWFRTGFAYSYSESEAKGIWEKVPKDTDILLTHGPPYERLDRTMDGRYVGCKKLAQRIRELDLLHVVCGHIHSMGGRNTTLAGTKIWNAAAVDDRLLVNQTRNIQTFDVARKQNNKDKK